MRTAMKWWINHRIDAIEAKLEENERAVAIATLVILATSGILFIAAYLMLVTAYLLSIKAPEGHLPTPTRESVVRLAPRIEVIPTTTPTSSPTPTSTITPTATRRRPSPTSTVDPEEGEYVVWGISVGQEASTLFRDFRAQDKLLAMDPTLLRDPKWKRRTVAIIAEIQAVVNEVVTYPRGDVPDRFRPAHEELVLGAKDLGKAMDAYSVWIDDLDEVKLEEAKKFVNDSIEHFDAATELMPGSTPGGREEEATDNDG